MGARGYIKQSLASTTSAVAWTINYHEDFEAMAIALTINTAPTSAGSITVQLDNASGAVLRTVDPVALAATSVSFENLPGIPYGSTLYVAYANPDGRTITGSVISDVD